MKNILVTGAAGFIGANFVKYLLGKYDDLFIVILDKLTYAGNLVTIEDELKNPNVEFVHGDICDQKLVSELFVKYDFDRVVNFAAESHVDRSIENPQLFLQTNILGTQNLLDCAKKAWTIGKDDTGYPVYKTNKKYLQVSTDEVYGSLTKDFDRPQKIKIKDPEMLHVLGLRNEISTYGKSFFTEETPLDPRSPYSASKTGADLIVKAYAETYKFPINITRCSNNYGPYHYPEKLIPLVIQKVLKGEKIPVYGKGDNVRDWLYVEDHAKAIDLVMHKGRDGEVYNVGGFNEATNIQIVHTIISNILRLMSENEKYHSVLQTELSNINEDLIEYVEDRLGHDQRYAIDPSKITKELGWYPETNFNDGIEKTVCWYLENQEWIKQIDSKQ